MSPKYIYPICVTFGLEDLRLIPHLTSMSLAYNSYLRLDHCWYAEQFTGRSSTIFLKKNTYEVDQTASVREMRNES